MKKYIFLIFCFFSTCVYSQYNCKSLFNSNNSDYKMSFEGSKVEFFSPLRDDYGNIYENTVVQLYDCSYRISNDTLAIFDCYYYFEYDELYDPNIYYFKIIKDGILKSLSDFSNICKKGDIFYCSTYINEYYQLMGNKWKNGKKNGLWFYKDDTGVYNYNYKDDKIIEIILIHKFGEKKTPQYQKNWNQFFDKY